MLVKQSGFHPFRSTTDMIFVVRRQQKMGERQEYHTSSAPSTFRKSMVLSIGIQVISRLGASPKIITVIHEIHDEMKACLRSKKGTYLKAFDVNQRLQQGYVFSPL